METNTNSNTSREYDDVPFESWGQVHLRKIFLASPKIQELQEVAEMRSARLVFDVELDGTIPTGPPPELIDLEKLEIFQYGEELLQIAQLTRARFTYEEDPKKGTAPSTQQQVEKFEQLHGLPSDEDDDEEDETKDAKKERTMTPVTEATLAPNTVAATEMRKYKRFLQSQTLGVAPDALDQIDLYMAHLRVGEKQNINEMILEDSATQQVLAKAKSKAEEYQSLVTMAQESRSRAETNPDDLSASMEADHADFAAARSAVVAELAHRLAKASLKRWRRVSIDLESQKRQSLSTNSMYQRYLLRSLRRAFDLWTVHQVLSDTESSTSTIASAITAMTSTTLKTTTKAPPSFSSSANDFQPDLSDLNDRQKKMLQATQLGLEPKQTLTSQQQRLLNLTLTSSERLADIKHIDMRVEVDEEFQQLEERYESESMSAVYRSINIVDEMYVV
jgi:hypothetical protein